MDTLALGYILPATGRIRDFHPLERAPAGRTIKKAFTPKSRGEGLLHGTTLIIPLMGAS